MNQYAIRKRSSIESPEVTQNWINRSVENGWELFQAIPIPGKEILYIFVRWIDKK